VQTQTEQIFDFLLFKPKSTDVWGILKGFLVFDLEEMKMPKWGGFGIGAYVSRYFLNYY